MALKPRLLIYKILKQILHETYVFFGKLKEKNLRDMDETVNLAKRGGRRVDTHNLS